MTSEAFAPSTTVVSDGKSLLTSQWAKDPYVNGVLESILNRVQEIEGAAALQAVAMSIENAPFTYQLDRIGRILVLEREGRSNTVYRLWLAARVLAIKSRGKNREMLAIARKVAPVGTTIIRTRYGNAAFEIIFDGEPLTVEEGSAVAQILRSARRAGIYFRFAWQTSAEAETLRLAYDATLDTVASHGLGAEIGGDSLGLRTYWQRGVYGILGQRLVADYDAARSSTSSPPTVLGILNAAQLGFADLMANGPSIDMEVDRDASSLVFQDDASSLQNIATASPLLLAGSGFVLAAIARLYPGGSSDRWIVDIGKASSSLLSIRHNGTTFVAEADTLPAPVSVSLPHAIPDTPAFVPVVFDVGPTRARLFVGDFVTEQAIVNTGLSDSPDQIRVGNSLTTDTTDVGVSRVLVAQRSDGSVPQDVTADDLAVDAVVSEVNDLDWRNHVPFIQAAFRAGESRGGKVVGVEDLIEPRRKSVASERYMLAAPSSSQRPDLNADGSMTFQAASQTVLCGAAALADMLNADHPYTAIVLGRQSGALSGLQPMVAVVSLDSFTEYIEMAGNEPGQSRGARRTAAVTQLSGVLGNDEEEHVFSSSFDGVSLTSFRDDLSGPSNGSTQTPIGLNVVSFGALFRSTPSHFANITLKEVIVCAGSLPASTIAYVGERLRGDWS